jgi:uncharacterized protein YjaG (DUF416 family)
MNLQIFDITVLKQQLNGLSFSQNLAFSAACCERILPNYNAFSRTENWGNPGLLRAAVDEVWQILQGKPVDRVKINQLMKDCEDVIPDTEDFTSEYTSAALDASIAVYEILNACIDEDILHIVEVAKCARETVYMFVDERDNLESYSAEQILGKSIFTHPLMLREITQQEQDLQLIRNTNRLDESFLKMLRNSFDNNGKSNINVI